MTSEEAIDLLDNLIGMVDDNHDSDYDTAIKMAIKALEQEPKTGHWIDDTSLGYHVSICSNCDWRGHGDTCLIYKPKYCPNCGTRMESKVIT